MNRRARSIHSLSPIEPPSEVQPLTKDAALQVRGGAIALEHEPAYGKAELGSRGFTVPIALISILIG
jgi:hypothetical protein